MSRRGHIAVRTCIGCGQRDSQREMTRVVLRPGGDLAIDRDRSAGGRGGYLHDSDRCWQTFSRRKGMIRSFRAPVRSQVRAALLVERNAGAGL